MIRIAVTALLMPVQMLIATSSLASTPPSADPLGLEEVLVIATTRHSARMQHSLSVSTIDTSQFAYSASINPAELLRSVPGLRAESSGGEGNANITVRGVPLSAGGARYVQLQEDGLPVLQFGDIAFATADQFLRLDYGLERIEVVRGGSASTLASNSPGAVVNMISQTGATQSGHLAISQGLDFDRSRYDAAYGQPFNQSNTQFFVAGFYRQGEGPRDAGLELERGYQLRGNLTQHFALGYIRLSVKELDDQVPMALPVPVSADNGKISTLPGMDPRSASLYSPYWVNNPTIDADNQPQQRDINDGLTVNSRTYGASIYLAGDRGWSLDNKFRLSDNSGRFTAIFPADNGFDEGPFSYATGPLAGQPYSAAVITATVFDVAINDVGNTLNDLTLSQQLSLNDDTQLDLALGFYYARQQLDLTWHFNQYLLARDGSQPALIASPATSAATPGLLARGTEVWDSCCVRDIDAEYRTEAPYVSFNVTTSRWQLDASLRQERQQARGHFTLAENQQFSATNSQPVDYQIDETAYSLGLNYFLWKDLAIFLRNSQGHAFNADRIMFNGYQLDGSVTIPVNRVRQTELGIKWRRPSLSTFITLFDARTRETNYEATTQLFTDRDYQALGMELEMAYSLGNFHLQAGATYTDAEISRAEDRSLQGNSPRRQADWTYQLQPSYQTEQLTIGLSLLGSTEAWGDDSNTLRLDDYTIVNAFVELAISEQFSLQLLANNLGNELAFTEVENDGHAARALDGRHTQLQLHYTF